MKVYVEPPGHLSQAMFRVARALKNFAPAGIEVVETPELADLHVLHVIGPEAVDYHSPASRIAVIQYCTHKMRKEIWWPLWQRADVVWSYYDLSNQMPEGAEFYLAPLGLDPAFLPCTRSIEYRSIGVVTSGYVTGPGAEAIQEMARACDAVGLTTVHIGPKPVGVKGLLPKTWLNLQGIPDEKLADVYCHARWVSGLRYIEGFELPALEGLACGARPIVFDRPDMRQWYDGHAVFVPELEDMALINVLVSVLGHDPEPVGPLEKTKVVKEFSWQRIVEGFWEVVMKETYA